MARIADGVIVGSAIVKLCKQYGEDCIPYVKEYVREMKEDATRTRWILSGSSMTRLFKKNHRIPVGRFAKYKINPFSFVGFLNVAGKPNLIETVVNFSPENKISDYLHNE